MSPHSDNFESAIDNITIMFDFFDAIELKIRSGEKCKIVFLDDGNQLIIHDALKDVVRHGNDDYLLTGSGMEIRMDQIFSINDRVSPFLC